MVCGLIRVVLILKKIDSIFDKDLDIFKFAHHQAVFTLQYISGERCYRVVAVNICKTYIIIVLRVYIKGICFYSHAESLSDYLLILETLLVF